MPDKNKGKPVEPTNYDNFYAEGDMRGVCVMTRGDQIDCNTSLDPYWSISGYFWSEETKNMIRQEASKGHIYGHFC